MLPNLKSILIEGFEETARKPMKSRQFTYKDMQGMFNLQSLFITKKPMDELGGEKSTNAQGEDSSDEVVASISHEKFPLTIEYYYGYGGKIDEDQDEILIKDKDGNVLEHIPNTDGRFQVVKKQLYKFFHHDDG
jgi:hypothetical protein